MLPVKIFMSILHGIVIKSQILEKNQHKTITLAICETEFRENLCLKITWLHVRLQNYGE